MLTVLTSCVNELTKTKVKESNTVSSILAEPEVTIEVEKWTEPDSVLFEYHTENTFKYFKLWLFADSSFHIQYNDTGYRSNERGLFSISDSLLTLHAVQGNTTRTLIFETEKSKARISSPDSCNYVPSMFLRPWKLNIDWNETNPKPNE